MAAMLPMSVLFHIHQVVAALKMSSETKEYPKKLRHFFVLSATINKGTKATKMRKQNGDIGQAP